jgi:hydrogenase maturation protease
MSKTLVDRIANAVLYEGYVLYPYRPSVKNRQRWTFGGVYPRAYCETHSTGDAWAMQTECLALGEPTINVQVRFLHLVERTGGDEVPTWQEAVERAINVGETDVFDLLRRPRREPFSFPGSLELGPVRREQRALAGTVEVAAERLGAGPFKVTVRVRNETPLEDAGQTSREEAQRRALVSTHTILGVRGGEFVSLIDPPEGLREAAAGCRNVGTWPVLVGEEGQKDTLLSSPITLYDYPQVAPESPGNLFDGTEIDEILTLRILSLTDEEKRSAAAVDGRVRELLARTEALAREELLGLHGTFRKLRPPPGGGA